MKCEIFHTFTVVVTVDKRWPIYVLFTRDAEYQLELCNKMESDKSKQFEF